MKAGDFVIRSTDMERKIISKHNKRVFESPSHGTFPSNGLGFQKSKWKKIDQDRFNRDVELVVKYERRKRMQVLLIELGSDYLEGLRKQCIGILRVA